MFWQLIWAFLLVLVLVFWSGLAVDLFEKVTKEMRINKLLVATFLVSFSTSLPEFAVGMASAFRGESQIALGNILGANLANLSWIIGMAALVAGSIPVVGEFLKKDLWVTLWMALAPFLLMADGSLSRLDGLMLVVAYIFYVRGMVCEADMVKASKLRLHKPTLPTKNHLWMRVGRIVKLVVVLVMMAITSHYLIGAALNLSSSLGVNAFWVGLLVVTFGTTLPELALSVFASEKRDISLVLGNMLGSVVINSTFILGSVAILSPMTFETTLEKSVSGIFMIVVLGLFWLFTKTKKRLDKWEGAVLIGIYLMFVGVQLMFS